MSNKESLSGTIFLVDEAKPKLYAVSPTTLEAELLLDNLSSSSMAVLSRDGTTLAAVTDYPNQLYIWSASRWEKPEAVIKVHYGTAGGEFPISPELAVTSDGSLICLTDPFYKAHFNFRRQNSWRLEEKTGNRPWWDEKAQSVDGDLRIIKARIWRSRVQSFLGALVPGIGGFDYGLSVAERSRGENYRTLLWRDPRAHDLNLRFDLHMSERGDTIAVYKQDWGKIYLFRRDDREQSWQLHESDRHGHSRGIVMSSDGMVVVTSESLVGPLERIYYPYDAFAHVWNGRTWNHKLRLSGPFDGERYGGEQICAISLDKRMVVTPEYGVDKRKHYLCCTQLGDEKRICELPTQSNSYFFSPDGRWVVYRERGAVPEDWKDYIIKVDGTENHMVFSQHSYQGHRLLGWAA